MEAAANLPAASSKKVKHTHWAMRLQGVKPDLTKEDLQKFHKPRLRCWKLKEEKDRSRPILVAHEIGSAEGAKQLKFKFKKPKKNKGHPVRDIRQLDLCADCAVADS